MKTTTTYDQDTIQIGHGSPQSGLKLPTKNVFRNLAVATFALAISLQASYAGKPPAGLTVSANDPKIQYTGRVDFTTPTAPVLYWAGNQVAIAFQGTGLSIKLDCLTRNENNYLNVVIDGGASTTLRAIGSGTYSIASGLPQGTHTARISRENDWDTVHGIAVNGFIVTGNPAVVTTLPARPTRRIEFYGDSITSGMGILGDQNNMANEKNSLAYGTLAARNFGAEYTCISRSGIGIVSSWYPTTMPQVYNRLNPFDSASLWNFNTWTPDVVVINLGQNDYWIIGSPDATTMTTAYQNFFTTIRSKYPNAFIVAALGCMDAVQSSSPFPGYISNAVTAMNDPKIISHTFPYLSDAHPNAVQHQMMAEELTTVISSATGWQIPGGPVASGTYTITAKSSGKVFSVIGNSTTQGTNLEQRVNGGTVAQQWTAIYLNNGYYKIVNVNSGLAIDVAGASTADGANVLQWPYNGANNQQWQLVSAGGGYYSITAKHSGKALGVRANALTDGALIEQRTYTGAANQLFILE